MKPFFDDNEIQEVKSVLSSGWVAQGPKVREFEIIVARHEEVKYGIATTSCTTALHLTMVALGFSRGHDVIVPSFTFIATANAVEYTGATPVLVDNEIDTYNISIESIERCIESNYTKKGNKLINKKTGNQLYSIVAVHLFGLCANIVEINKIAKLHGIKVVEDGACSLGATINGSHPGNFGNPSCLSFHPRKSITTGEGGMILTDDEDLEKNVRKLRSHGASLSEIGRHESKGYLLPEFNELGFNYRMSDIHAAVGVAQINKIDKILKIRREKASYYNKLLQGILEISTPFVPEDYGHAYQSYVCLINNTGLSVERAHTLRNTILDELETMGISTRQGTHAVHLLGYYRKKYGYQKNDLPHAYRCDRLSITLPLYIGMKVEDQEYVVSSLKKCLVNTLKNMEKNNAKD